MANCFAKKDEERSSGIKLAVSLAIGAAIISAFIFSVRYIDKMGESERLQSANDALVRTAVQCYAIEGQYAPDYSYLKEHYGLSIDEKKYIVIYRGIAGNMLPEMEVVYRYF